MFVRTPNSPEALPLVEKLSIHLVEQSGRAPAPIDLKLGQGVELAHVATTCPTSSFGR